jgi:hypothetical protein
MCGTHIDNYFMYEGHKIHRDDDEVQWAVINHLAMHIGQLVIAVNKK